jgi:drug/metabolite transporter (DMT)-like permease
MFGWLLLGERVAWSDLIGVIPVALGIYLVTRAGRPRLGREKPVAGSQPVPAIARRVS